MFELTPVEIIGYVASGFVVASLAMSSVVRLRILSLTGSSVFLVYAVLIGSVPIIITNLAIACINIWYLRQELGLRRDLGAVRIPVDSPFLIDFLHHHLDDIRRFQPAAALPEPAERAVAVLLMRDGLPAGAVVGERDGTALQIGIDYVIKPYRDSRLGRWLFGQGADVFRNAGFDRLVTEPGDTLHRRYLESMGFRRDDERYVLDLSSPAR
jgi:hypothetical protein